MLFPLCSDPVFRQVLVWKQTEGKLVVVAADIESEEFPLGSSKHVRGQSLSFWEYERLAPQAGVPQTRVTYVIKIDLKGSIPKFIVNSKAVSYLMYLSSMRMRFDKSMEIDAASRAAHVESIAGEGGGGYTEEENEIVEWGVNLFNLFDAMKTKKIKLPSPLASARIGFSADSSDTHAWGWGSTTVRARPKEVLAFLWDTRSRAIRSKDDLEKSVDEQVNGGAPLGVSCISPTAGTNTQTC